MEFWYRDGDACNPSTEKTTTLVNSDTAGTHAHGENSEAMAPRLLSGRDELWHEKAKERIRERILQEEAETLSLEAEVWCEIMKEWIPLLRRSTSGCACAVGSEARAVPADVSSLLKTLIGHEVGPKPGVCVSAALPAKQNAVGSTLLAAISNKKLKPDLTSTTCSITVTGEGAMQEHLKGKNRSRKAAKLTPTLSGAHRREVSSEVNGSAAWPAKEKNPNVAVASTFFAATSSNEQKPDLSCTMCGITSTSQEAMQDHLEGKLHTSKAATLAQPMSKEDVVTNMIRSKPNAAAAAALLPAKRKISRAVAAASTISAAASSEKQKQGLACTPCGITATGEKVMQDHLKGKARGQKETEEEGAYTPWKLNIGTNSGTACEVVQMNGYLLCEVCDVKTGDLLTMRCHLEGGEHISKAADASVDETVAVEVNGVRRVDGFLLCELCDVKAASEIVMRSHLAGKKHTGKQKAAVDAGAGGKAVLAQAKTDKDVAVVDVTVTPGQQAKKAEAAATVRDSNKPVVLDIGGVQHVVEKVDGFFFCACCKVKAPSECVMRSHLVGKKHKDKDKVGALDTGAGGKRAVLAEAKSKEAASVVVHGIEGQGNGESVEKSAVDERAEAGDNDTAKAEEEKVDDAKEEEAVETNGVAAVEVKIQVEGKVITVLRQADGSLSCGLCGLHGCDKDRMLKHLYTGEHWHRARLSKQNEEQAGNVVVSNDSDGVVTPVTDGAAQVKK